ncbi:MAG: serine hydrolase [Wenzhouxiangella sp.]
MTRRTLSALSIIILLIVPTVSVPAPPAPDWAERLELEIQRIDDAMPGQLGVYIRSMADGASVRHRTDRNWYLASTIKIPLAIALMQKVEAGELAMDDELELAESDFVDGAGDLLWHEPGSRFTLDELNRRSVSDSDSTATDMLIRLVGVEQLNSQIARTMISSGFGPVTTILQVRYDAYGEIAAAVETMSNIDFIELRSEGGIENRYQRVLDILAIDAAEAGVSSGMEAFRRYYARGINSGNLESFGILLERLVRGELLNEAHTRRVLQIMEEVTTGEHRIKAGLPAHARFAHKTGTQIARACNVGILNPHSPDKAVLVLACAEDYDQLNDADMAFRKLGQALSAAGLVDGN